MSGRLLFSCQVAGEKLLECFVVKSVADSDLLAESLPILVCLLRALAGGLDCPKVLVNIAGFDVWVVWRDLDCKVFDSSL